jgi:hypothetical protein
MAYGEDVKWRLYTYVHWLVYHKTLEMEHFSITSQRLIRTKFSRHDVRIVILVVTVENNLPKMVKSWKSALPKPHIYSNGDLLLWSEFVLLVAIVITITFKMATRE